jgi:geranylgeranyl pyrophosphate synthase
MNQLQIKINDFIKNKIIISYPIELHDQVNYFYNDGKRLRPCLLLCWAGYKITDLELQLSILVETIHNLSLIIDDLPSMDNDQERRGKPTYHIKYGTSETYFFTYYMFNKLILMINNIEECFNISPINIVENENVRFYITYINEIINRNLDGLIDGQFIDLHIKSNTLINNRLEFPDLYNDEKNFILLLLKNVDINVPFDKLKLLNTYIELSFKKTSTLFTLSCILGLATQLLVNNVTFINNDVIVDTLFPKLPIIMNYRKGHKIIRENTNLLNGQELLNKVGLWSNILGFVFQVSDDILDFDNDKIQNNPNIAILLELPNTIELVKITCKWLKEELKNIESNLNIIDIRLDIQFNTIIEIIENIEKRIS